MRDSKGADLTTSSNTAQTSNSFFKRWGIYFAKALALVAFLFLMSKALPNMPPIAIGVFWVLFSIVSAAGLTYHSMIEKILKRHKYKPGSFLAHLNEGRALRTGVNYVIAAIAAAGLLIKAPAWGTAEWVLALLAVPGYMLVYIAVGKWVETQYEPDYQTSSTVFISVIVAFMLLCLAAVIVSMAIPGPTYATASEAYSAADNFLSDSSSAILSEFAMLSSFLSWVPDYAISKASVSHPLWISLLRAFFIMSPMFGLASLFGTCAIEQQELKRIFLPLASDASTKIRKVTVAKYAIVPAILSVLLCAGFAYADNKVGETIQTGEHTFVVRIIHDAINIVVYEMDGKYLDTHAVEGTLEEIKAESQKLSDEMKEKLVKFATDSSRIRRQNVDNYLEWYYGLPGSFERLVQSIGGSDDAAVEDKFLSYIDEGIDSTQIDKDIDEYNKQIEQLERDYNAQLEKCEIKDVPESIVMVEKKVKPEQLHAMAFKPSERFVTVMDESGIGIATTIGAMSVIGGSAVKLTGKLLFRGVLKGATMLARANIVAGVVLTGIDYLLLQSGEQEGQLNREEHHAAIMAEIDKQYEDTLDKLNQWQTDSAAEPANQEAA